MLIGVVRQASAEDRDQHVVISPDRTETYGECLARAEAIARGLTAAGIERFGLAVAHPADIVAALVGASAVGAEPCLYPRDLDAAGLDRFAASFGHDVVVTDEALALAGARAVVLADLELDGEPPADDPTAAPVLILTTGTTGDQKGTRHDWGRLMDGVRRRETTPGRRWLLAYNLNQFAGVQILLHVLASHATLVVPASRRPDDVIDAIVEQRVTHVSATPTFWRLIVGRLEGRDTAALPLEQITLGGEAAPEGLIEKLRALFPEARISHVYAGSEFGSAVSVRDGRSGMPLSVLDRDDQAPVQLRIVDGELHIRSRVGMLGYHHDADTAAEWRPTGDLVEVRDDRIHFVGRTTEIINVGGAKVHPLPVEEVICAVEGVQIAAVYGRSNPITGQIVVADVVAAEGADTTELEARIREACAALPAAGRPRRFRFVDALEVRGSKVVRQQSEESA